MINPYWLELPMSRTSFHGPKDVRAIEVRLYVGWNEGSFTLIFRVHSFDILCLLETKLLVTDVISYEEYTFIYQPRSKNFTEDLGARVSLSDTALRNL